MKPALPHLSPTQFRTPAIRHLAWMCHAPQLVTSARVFNPAEYLPADLLERLHHWDNHHEAGPAVLTETPNPRLGLYFERLYECLMHELLGWQVLARNLQIRSAGATLGELDFVLRNPRSGDVEHHEIAVKFYLGYNSEAAGVTLWHGPNAIDRLDLKTHNILEHQSQRTQLVETRAALRALGIGEPLTARIFMPGYLFYPREYLLSVPARIPHDHLRGHWVYLREALEMHTGDWVPLRKPHWLGPWVQSEAPDPADAESALNDIALSDTPRLFASMKRHEDSGHWQETERFFVVPARWPGC